MRSPLSNLENVKKALIMTAVPDTVSEAALLARMVEIRLKTNCASLSSLWSTAMLPTQLI